MHGSSFKERPFIPILAKYAKELLKHNNTIKTYLIRLNIVLLYS